MGYIVIKGEEIMLPYLGGTVYFDGLLYGATSLALPTVFEKKETAQKAINKSRKKWPNIKFEIVNEEEKTLPTETFLQPVDLNKTVDHNEESQEDSELDLSEWIQKYNK